jgi:3-phosphoshikimate 1-carboxyvinyltransferase
MHNVTPQLPASKSISNRLLIMNALSGSVIKINNLSTANDTVVLNRILASHLSHPTSILTEINCEDAGTVMRFLTAYFSMQNGQWLLRGTDRMHQRPIKILVEKLQELGADIKYLGEKGYPPLLINGKNLNGGEISLDASISSQYITALMLIAPYLVGGLQINLKGKLASLPYIKMTLGLMQQCGIDLSFEGDQLNIKQGRYASQQISVESDWSAASYWYAFAALKEVDIELKGLQQNSLQGDSIVAKWMEGFGVKTDFAEDRVVLRREGKTESYFEQDFTNCPDLAPTFIVLCAVTATSAKFFGVESLAIKESDRTQALATELGKVGVNFTQKENYWELQPNTNLKEITIPIELDTYSDHRMAMALAMFKLILSDVTINNPEVVKKSYPNFWQDFESFFNHP